MFLRHRYSHLVQIVAVTPMKLLVVFLFLRNWGMLGHGNLSSYRYSKKINVSPLNGDDIVECFTLSTEIILEQAVSNG